MILLITLGDPNGIGPEVTAKSVRPFARRRPVVLIGPEAALAPWEKYLGRMPVQISPGQLAELSGPRVRGLYSIDPEVGGFQLRPGRMTRGAARAAMRSFEVAVRLMKKIPKRFALVTAPVSKESCLRAGLPFTGHTGYLGRAFHAAPLMVLIAGRLGVGLVTEHIPLASVPNEITRARVLRALRILAGGLPRLGAGSRPTIRVLGLNPHAGEGGRIGAEDARIAAAVRAFNALGSAKAVGPLPADSAFSAPSPPSGGDGRGEGAGAHAQIFLAMYHDQGLIPVKMSGLHRAVNVTLGLPVIRTSPAHGTAFDIAGRGVADPRSMRLAIQWALR